MKQFSCGDIVPGCTAVFQADHEQAVLALVADHAKKDHGIMQVPLALVEQVRGLMLDLPSAAA